MQETEMQTQPNTYMFKELPERSERIVRVSKCFDVKIESNEGDQHKESERKRKGASEAVLWTKIDCGELQNERASECGGKTKLLETRDSD